MSLGRRIARCFVLICDERPEPKKKFIPNSNIEYEREISDAAGNLFAYAQKDGNWKSFPKARKIGASVVIDNSDDVSFQVMKLMQEPVKLPENIRYTALGIIEE